MQTTKFKKYHSVLVVLILLLLAFLISIHNFPNTYEKVSVFSKSLSNKFSLGSAKFAESYNDVIKKKPLVVFLVSQCRSGSSVLGELFNQRSGVTYIYEPLYPLRTRNGVQSPPELLNATKELVEDMARCKFTQLPHFYR